MSPAHPNRSAGRKPGRNPKPAEIAQLRGEMEMTQTEFGAVFYRSARTVQDWEAGTRRMPPDTWEYACLLQAYPQVQRARRLWLDGQADIGQA